MALKTFTFSKLTTNDTRDVNARVSVQYCLGMSSSSALWYTTLDVFSLLGHFCWLFQPVGYFLVSLLARSRCVGRRCIAAAAGGRGR